MGRPGYEMAAGDGPGRLRAAHADRERVIDTLKAAYVYGLVTKNELDERLSQTFAARTHAQLAVITADIPSGLAPLRPAPARASAPAAARDRAIMATAILTGLAWVAAFVVSPDAGPGPSVAGALAALLFVGGTGSAFVSLFLLGIQMRSQRTQHPGRQLPPRRRRVGSGTSAAHKTISATSAEQLPRAARPRRGTTDAARRHSLRPQLSS